MVDSGRPAPLSAEQSAVFDREGYLVVEDVFTAGDFQPLIDEITAEVDRRARECVAAGELSRDFHQEPFETRLTRISAETDKVAMGIWNGVLAGPAVFNVLRHGPLLDIAEQLCGPELIASSVYRLRPKIPNHIMGPVPWHQDSGYFEPYCDNAMVLTVWVPLVDATEANGCLWVVPRAHKGHVVRHVQRRGKPYLVIPGENLPAGAGREPVCVPVKKGAVLLMTNLTPHASFENKTETVRWAMDLRYQSAALPTNARITRLPGESVEGQGVPGACYPPEADFLVRSRQRPGEVVASPQAFAELRSGHKPGALSRRWETVEG